MEKNNCCTCFKPKATLTCGLCKESVCKYCAQFLQDDSFSFLPNRAAELKENTFCGPCFDSKVAPSLKEYNQLLARAKEVQVFTKDQYKETRFIKRDEDPVKITACDDRDELVLRLAFEAARKNCDGLVDVELVSTKIRNGSYQTTQWTGTGIPTQIQKEKLVRDRSFRNKPN
jgi:hypothetical protein